jgi:oligopeptide transport system permease protein
MGKVIAWRVAQFPLILAVIYVLTFLLAWVAPGSPFEGERNMSPDTIKALKERFSADSPVTFLTTYPWKVITQGDFGPSLQYREWSVNDILASSLPVSITVGLFAMTVAVFVGVTVGAMAAARRNGLLDYASMSITLIGISLPSFVTAAVMLLVFSGWLKIFPVGSWGSIRDVILPGLALSLAPMAYIVRLQRVAMLDVLGSDYVRTARAKGLSTTVVIWKHCLRNAFLPVLSYLGPATAATLTGSFVVEKVFNVPGLGQHFVNSVLNRDQTLILGVVMVYSALLLGLNLIVDLCYTLVDPRIDLGK